MKWPNCGADSKRPRQIQEVHLLVQQSWLRLAHSPLDDVELGTFHPHRLQGACTS